MINANNTAIHTMILQYCMFCNHAAIKLNFCLVISLHHRCYLAAMFILQASEDMLIQDILGRQGPYSTRVLPRQEGVSPEPLEVRLGLSLLAILDVQEISNTAADVTFQTWTSTVSDDDQINSLLSLCRHVVFNYLT